MNELFENLQTSYKVKDLYWEAKKHADSNEYEEAISVYQRAAKLASTYSDYFSCVCKTLAGECAVKGGNYQLARNLYEETGKRIVEKDISGVDLLVTEKYFYFAVLCELVEDTAKAKELYEAYLKLDKSFEAHYKIEFAKILLDHCSNGEIEDLKELITSVIRIGQPCTAERRLLEKIEKRFK